MINGVIKVVYEDDNNTVATFPVTKEQAVLTSEGDSIDIVYDKNTYAVVNVPTTGWAVDSEGVATKTVSLTGAKAGKHPIISCKISSKSAMEAELEAFSTLMSIVEVDNALELTAASAPVKAIDLEVKNY